MDIEQKNILISLYERKSGGQPDKIGKDRNTAAKIDK